MARSIGILFVIGCWAVMSCGTAEAKDHPIAKSLTKTGSLRVASRRACTGQDVLGNWELVRFDSAYRFRNPQAPYLFPHQVFQYSTQGGAKSAHSFRPIFGSPDALFATVPLKMIYHVERKGRVILKTRGRDEPVETWSCEVVTPDHATAGQGDAMQRGDLIMTLLGSGGQPLFVRYLRRSAA